MEVVPKLSPLAPLEEEEEAACASEAGGGGPALMQHTGGRIGGPLVLPVDCGTAAPGARDLVTPGGGGTSRLVVCSDVDS